MLSRRTILPVKRVEGVWQLSLCACVCAPQHRDQQTLPTRLQGAAVDVQSIAHESLPSITSVRDDIVGPKIVGS